jgi:hypothetical protein
MTIAKGRIFGVFTITKGNSSCFLYLKFLGRKACALVSTIAKGLVYRFPAGTPPISTRFDVENGRFVGCNYWLFLTHQSTLVGCFNLVIAIENRIHIDLGGYDSNQEDNKHDHRH